MKTATLIPFLLLAAGLTAPGQTNSLPAAPAAPPPAQAAPAAATPPARQIPPASLPFGRFLNDEQRTLFRAARTADQDKIQALTTRVLALRQEMWELVLADKFDEAAFRAKSEAVAKLQVEFDVLSVQSFLKIRPLLTTNQVENIRNAMAPVRSAAPPAP